VNLAKQQRRQQLYGLLGDLPDRDRAISVEKIGEEQREGYILERLMLDLNGIEVVPAYFVRPASQSNQAPAVLYNHWHGGDYDVGKDELITGGRGRKQGPYAEDLTSMGYCALAIDHWVFGERRGRTESETFKQMLWQGQVMWGMMVYDSLRAIDYLVSRDEVDSERLATIGMSMGSTMAWWVAALDTRVKVCIDICCLTDFQALIETRGLDGHGIYYYVPSLLKHFSTAQINELIAPRPHLSLAGNYDPLTPPAGLDRIDAYLKQVYAAKCAPEAWRLVRHDVGHIETAAMRAEALKFLQLWL